jgi:hypothetical protein
LSKLKSDQHIEINLDMSEMDLTSAESKATYAEIKTYVMDKYQIKVSSLNIAQSLQLQSLFLMKIKERRQLNYRGFPLFILNSACPNEDNPQ